MFSMLYICNIHIVYVHMTREKFDKENKRSKCAFAFLLMIEIHEKRGTRMENFVPLVILRCKIFPTNRRERNTKEQ